MPRNQFPYALITAILLVLSMALALRGSTTTQHPYIAIDTPDNIRISFLFGNKRDASECRRILGDILSPIRAACSQCRVITETCLGNLDTEQQRLLSQEPIPQPSARIENGITLFQAAAPELALQACRQSEQQADENAPITCYPADTPRPMPRKLGPAASAQLAIIALVAALTAWLAGYLIIRFEHLHAHLSHDIVDSGPQKFHATPTPRIGGLALIAGLLAAGSVLLISPGNANEYEFGYLLVAAIPAFLGGIIEDITKKVGVIERLLLTMLSAALAAWLLGAILDRLDIPFLDDALNWQPLAILFTVFAVGGIANAINIIDGTHGLASGVAIIVLAGIASVAFQQDDPLIATSALAILGSLAGFIVWNWPGGKLFLGDGGAYLLGFLIATLSVLLIVRNPDVSPWFPLLLLIHPVFETLFSIYRRKILRGHTPGRPDGLHLHQLIYARIVRYHVGSKNPDQKCRRNSLVAPYIWFSVTLFALAGVYFWNDTNALFGLSLAYGIFYMINYRLVMHWKVPAWIKRHA